MNNDGFVNLTSKDDPAGQNNSRDVTIWWTGGSRGRRCENLLNVNTMWGGSWQLNWGVHNNWVPLGFCAFRNSSHWLKEKTAQTQNLSWGLFWIIYIWRPIEATSQWSKRRRYILNQLIKSNYQETQWILIGGQKWISSSLMQFC